jgi:hypothetical protein
VIVTGTSAVPGFCTWMPVKAPKLSAMTSGAARVEAAEEAGNPLYSSSAAGEVSTTVAATMGPGTWDGTPSTVASSTIRPDMTGFSPGLPVWSRVTEPPPGRSIGSDPT